jgi:DNA-directed RNA polymerase I subunit RPA2
MSKSEECFLLRQVQTIDSQKLSQLFQARERLTSYRGRMSIQLRYRVNDNPTEEVITKDCGLLPIMVRVRTSLAVFPPKPYAVQSDRCNLKGMSSAQLVNRLEEPEEFGGYFVINGNERLIRYLILPRRHNVIGLVRPSFANRGPAYTPYAVSIRCVRPDETSVTNTLHYLSNGSAMLRFSWHKQEYVIPVMLILRAFCGASDKEIFEGIVMEDFGNTFLTDRVEMLLRSFKSYTLYTGDRCLQYLGEKFRVVANQPEDWDDMHLGGWLLEKLVLVHLKDAREKYNMMLYAATCYLLARPSSLVAPRYMIRKLFSLVSGDCCPDNPDSPQHQEILLSGSLYGMVIKEKLEEALHAIQLQAAQDLRKQPSVVDFSDGNSSLSP